MKPKNLLLWSYFDKIDSAYALCKLCSHKLSYRTTIYNLRCHLRSRHNIETLKRDDLTNNETENVTVPVKSVYKRPRKKTSWLWNVFKVKDGIKNVATCILCGRDLNFKSTTNNLKKHIELQHSSEYEQLKSHDKAGNESPSEEVSYDLEDSDDDSNSIQIDEVYFEECDGVIQCTVCKKNISDDGEDPKSHLEEHHPALLARMIKNDEKEEANESLDDEEADKDIFTEVVYLEPNLETNDHKRKYESKSYAKKRRLSSVIDNLQVNVKKTPSELESFINYITVLLKKLPSDVCSHVQLEIINLIMKAQFQSTSKLNESVQVITCVTDTSTTEATEIHNGM